MSRFAFLGTGVLLITASQPLISAEAETKPAYSSSRAALTPSPSAQESVAFMFTGDFVYYQAREDRLSIGSTGDTQASSTMILLNPSLSPTQFGHVENINFTYAPGFKIGLWAFFPHDGWDSYLNYTWFSTTKNTAFLEGKSSQGKFSTFFGPSDILNSPTPRVSASWDFYFNTVNWELGRKFWLGHYVTVRPHLGLKGAWNHQNFNVFFSGENTGIQSSLNVPLLYSHYQRQGFWGVGLRGGLDSEWFLVDGFSIYGNCACAELYGQFTSHYTRIIRDLSTGISLNNLRVRSVHQIQPVIELSLGLKYELLFGKGGYYHFLIQTGWEQQIWWNQNQMINIDTGSGNNLTIQGLDVKIGVTF